MYFFKNYAGNEADRLIPVFSVKITLYKLKANGLQLTFNITG